jgi:threonylcarbamoyladenosine tRNA methylthiotransferase MtaB
MVGVRGETTERWEQYIEFIQSLQVSQLHVFTYSERAGTRMLTMDLPVIPMTERHRRSQVLHGISEDKLQAFYALCSDMPQTVLWEGKNDHGVMYGFSENYIRHSRPFDKNRINTFEHISAQCK